MAGEEFPHNRADDVTKLFGATLIKAVAEGAALMARVAPEGSPEQQKWAGVVSRAAEVGPAYLSGQAVDLSDEPSDVVIEPSLSDEERAALQVQLEELEAQADGIRSLLGE